MVWGIKYERGHVTAENENEGEQEQRQHTGCGQPMASGCIAGGGGATANRTRNAARGFCARMGNSRLSHGGVQCAARQ